MSDRKNQESRWNSAREREERDKQRKAQRDEAKRARLEREANAKSAGSSSSDSGQRRLTDDERRTIREYRFPSASERARSGSESPKAPGSPSTATAATASSLTSAESSASGTSTKWRDSVAPAPATGGPGSPGLPDLPGDGGGSGGKRPGNGRLLIFGIGLFAVMALVAFLPFGPFGDEDERTVPTPSATLPSILDANDGEDNGADADPADAVEQPQAGDGQAIVCIDPGHGGWDPGWNRTDLGDDPYSLPTVTEAELNLGMAYMLRARLEELGYFVVMTRESGASVNPFLEDINEDGQSANNNVPEGAVVDQVRGRDEFQARINACNEAEADVLISLHINGVTDRDARGYEVIYTAEREFGEQNAALATLIYRQMDSAMRDTEMGGLGRGELPDTGVESEHEDSGFSEHLIMTGPAFEEGSIDPSLMPGAVIECAFLSNDGDAAWLVQTDNQQILVDAYAQGIADYFEQYPPT